MEKINSREKYVNMQFEQLINNYKSKNEVYAQKKLQVSEMNEKVLSLNNELLRVTEDLELLQVSF